MARRKDTHLLLLVADAPWPVGVVLGLVAFFGLRDVLVPLLAHSPNAILAALGGALSSPTGAWLPTTLLAAFWLAALVSAIRRWHRKRLLRTQTGLDSLRSMHWGDFERVVGEAFRQRGYRVEENGLGGADGGIDLLLKRDGRTTLVQCKQWRRQKVDVRVVREMFGLLAHHDAQHVIVVSVGDFTADAQRFAQGKPIELINGDALLALVREGQARLAEATTAAPGQTRATHVSPRQPRVEPDAVATEAASHDTARADHAPPTCPRCNAAMVRRANKQSGSAFWGCSRFPACRGTRALA